MRNSASRPVPPTLVDANRLWVDSRVRALVQRRVEAPVLLRLGGPVPGGRVLELGTGRRGTGLRLALEVIGAAHADGVERYETSVAACREAVRDLGGRVEVRRGDASAPALLLTALDAAAVLVARPGGDVARRSAVTSLAVLGTAAAGAVRWHRR
jgi:predicted RNA methylase